ncbi:MAG TPA: Ppx/GppA phosphatase family protein [Marmoricola sp.]|nr:Ppx/GppA phosphatase family protein [Marmoricola sp.]
MSAPTTRVAAFDCGTNSLRLLVADLDPTSGAEHEVLREMRIVRLGEGVDRTGRISDEAMVRVLAAVDDFAAMARDAGAGAVRFCATSAARDAANAAEFMTGVRDRVGVEPEVLAGVDEARASYAGATRSLPEAPAPRLVVDIGGGSTELILGDEDGRVLAEQSLDVGSVRLTERHLHDDPPTADQVTALEADVDALLDRCRVPVGDARTVIGVAGTVTTVAAGVLGLSSYDRTAIHHAVLRREDVAATTRALVGMEVSARRALGYMHPGRADVIGAGALILERVLARTTTDSLLVSEHDILDGIAWSLVSGA